MAPAIPFQRLKTIARKAAQSLQMRGGFEAIEALFCLALEAFEGRYMLARSKVTGPLVSIT
ncbi:MAG: hypothetical protein QOD93_1983 [Acetobacteraceae bacterium]|nr:hypothetical protein [Acetobacteraceae bacterium]